MTNHNSEKRSSGNEPFPVTARSPLMPMIFLLVFVTVIIGVLGVLQIRQTYTQTLSEAENTGGLLAGTLQQTIGSMLQKTDIVLNSIVYEVSHQSAGGGVQTDRLKAFIEGQFKMMPELENLRVSNSQGVLVSGSGPAPTVAVSIADRDYFRYLRDHPDAGMILSEPIIGKISKIWVISCARRVTLTDGAFGGVALAILPLKLFDDLFKGVPIGSQGLITLHSDDFSLITKYSPLQQEKNAASANTALIAPEWRALIAQGQTQNAAYTSDSSSDGIRRIYSYQRIASYPLYINVGLALDDVLRGHWTHLWVVTGILLVLLVTVVILVWQVYQNWRKTALLKRDFGRLELLQEVNQIHAANVQELFDFSLEKVIALTESSIGYIYNYSEEGT
ncbi:MAG: hypothetical protein ACOYL3_29135 [Desulfuromonadaceae bacterium]